MVKTVDICVIKESKEPEMFFEPVSSEGSFMDALYDAGQNLLDCEEVKANRIVSSENKELAAENEAYMLRDNPDLDAEGSSSKSESTSKQVHLDELSQTRSSMNMVREDLVCNHSYGRQCQITNSGFQSITTP